MLYRLVIGASATWLITACGANGDLPSPAEATAYAESAPPLGKAVDYFVYTHCGVDSIRVNGRWWHAVDPLYGEDGPGTAPRGWDLYQEGELTLHSEDNIAFEAKGEEIAFVPAPEDQPMTMCR